MNRIRWFLYVILVFSLLSCHKEAELKAQLGVPLTVFPASAQVKIGDTLWLSYFSQDSFLINLVNQEKISIIDKVFLFVMFISRADDWLNIENKPRLKFDFISEGDLSTGNSFYESKIGCNKSVPFFQLAIIPLEKGTFVLDPFVFARKGLYNKSEFCNVEDKLIQEKLTEIFYFFKNTDIHNEFVPKSGLLSSDLVEIQRRADKKLYYFFKVID